MSKEHGKIVIYQAKDGQSLLEQSGINENGLVALALLIAESDPKQKGLMIRLVMNLLTPNN